MRNTAIAAILVLSLSGCGATTQRPDTGGNRNLITLLEIQAAPNPSMNLWDFIAGARPHFLRDRGVGSFQNTTPVTAVVYLDGNMLGDIRSLRSISLSSVQLIEYMSGPDATTRYGMGHGGGAILLKSH
jgi:hypothetical protein